ncbi:MAG: Gfo/Idh/MocA family oxidoreductase, partial [Anaerolineae bacterium]|nr:Gfo/Idh/MocA family oxidoreductase [Anaerolineae bacterium]
EVSATEFLNTCPESFARPPVWDISIPVRGGHGGQHAEVLANFADAIRTGASLIAPAEEGINSVELANAMLFSSIKGHPVDLPLNSADYEGELQKLIATSTFEKEVNEQTASDMGSSFNS